MKGDPTFCFIIPKPLPTPHYMLFKIQMSDKDHSSDLAVSTNPSRSLFSKHLLTAGDFMLPFEALATQASSVLRPFIRQKALNSLLLSS